MIDLEQRLSALSPEKRRLAELMLRERRLRQGEDPRALPFGLVTAEDRPRLPEGLDDAYPLARLQLGMIYHMEMTLDDPVPAYHNVNSFHVKAAFDGAALQRAVDRVVARHATLRTSFHLEGYSEPLQLVHRTVAVPLRVADLRRLTNVDQERALEVFFRVENRRIFDLVRPPLLRIHVHLRSDDRFQFTLTEPHVISEGWSTTSTLAEIADVYLAMLEGREVPEPPSSLPYRAFVRMEKEILESEEAREFWRRRLADWGATHLPRWPERFRPSGRAKSRKPSWNVPADLMAGLERVARSAGVPIKSVLLAAHLKFLSLWSGDSRVTTGLEFHGRPESREGDQVRGVFINTLPLRLRLDGVTWTELARRAFDAETEVLPFRRYPLAALQEGRPGPLFETSFTYLHFHGVDRVFGYERMTLYRDGISDLSVSNFPLAVTFHRSEGGHDVVVLVLEYDDKAFSLPQVRAFRRTFEGILRAIAAAPDARHDRSPLLGPADAQRVLVEWGGAAPESPADETVDRSIARRVRETPDAVAVEQGGTAITYGELGRRAARLARELRAAGVGADAPAGPVGVCAERSCETIVALLGVLAAGGAYLPLDPGYPPQRLRFLLEDSGTTVVAAERRLADRVREAGVPTVLEIPTASRPEDTGTVPLDDARHGADDLAYVIYTSGSTGRPKGAMVSHRSLIASTVARPRVYGERAERFLLLSSYAFDSSVAGIFWTLCDGGTLVLPDPGAERDPEEIARLAAARRPSHLLAVPSLYALLLDEGAEEERTSPVGLAGLATAVVAGESCSAELVARHRARLPGTRLFNEYGPTEGTVWCSAADLTELAPGARPPIGRPVPGAVLRVLGEGMQAAPVGAQGELWLGGAGLARGYLGRPARTAERFVPAPWGDEPGARAYRTGDLARWLPDGNLEFLGRRDHQVKIGGFRIELEEVEAALGERTDLAEVAVLVRHDLSRDGGGEGGHDPRLVAYVVPRHGEGPSAPELRAFVAERLPEYMVPAYYVTLREMPVTPNGKLDRAALPAPSSDRPASAQEYVAPRDDLERALAEVWSEVLGIEKIGVHDNFFHLGGSSLLLIQAHRRQRAALETRLTLAEFFQEPTVAALAGKIRALREGGGEGAATRGRERAEARKEATGRAALAARRRALRRGDRS